MWIHFCELHCDHTNALIMANGVACIWWIALCHLQTELKPGFYVCSVSHSLYYVFPVCQKLRHYAAFQCSIMQNPHRRALKKPKPAAYKGGKQNPGPHALLFPSLWWHHYNGNPHASCDLGHFPSANDI